MDSSIADLLATPSRQGRNTLRATARRLIEIERPDLSELLDAEELLLEPLIFGYFASKSPQISLEQISAGQLVSRGKPLKCAVRTDSHGRIFIPLLGYLSSFIRDANVSLSYDPDTDRLKLEQRGCTLAFDIERPFMLPGTNIEVCRYPISMHDCAFLDSSRTDIRIATLNIDESIERQLATAIDAIKKAWPEMHALISANVRRIVLFESDDLNSFAAPRLHGTVFLNASLGDDEVFFTEDLAHQCGHVVFAAAILADPTYARNTIDGKWNRLNGERDPRELEVALHGLITEAFIAITLHRCLERNVFSAAQQPEVEGRLAFIIRRLADDAANIYRHDVLSQHGEVVISCVVSALRFLVSHHRALLQRASFTDQSYNFNYSVYKKENPNEVRGTTFRAR